MCLQEKSFKDDNKPAHWVVPSKLGSLDIVEFFKRTPKSDEEEASVTGKIEEDKIHLKIVQMNLIQM